MTLGLGRSARSDHRDRNAACLDCDDICTTGSRDFNNSHKRDHPATSSKRTEDYGENDCIGNEAIAGFGYQLAIVFVRVQQAKLS
jgi:hypothetical protein